MSGTPRAGLVLGMVSLVAFSTLLGYMVGLQALTPVIGALLLLVAGLTAANPRDALLLVLSVGCSLNLGFMLGGDVSALNVGGVTAEVQLLAFGFVFLIVVAVGTRGFAVLPRLLLASKPAVWASLFWLWCAFSLAWSSDPASGLRVLGQLLVIGMTALGVALLVSSRQLQKFSVSKSVVVAGVLSLGWSGIALLQGRGFTWVGDLSSGARLNGSMGAGGYAYFLLVTALAAWSIWGQTRDSWQRITRVWFAASVVLVVLTVSRTAWVAGLVSAMGVALATRRHGFAKAAAIAALALLALSVLPASLNRITTNSSGDILGQFGRGTAGLQMGGWAGRAKGWDYMITNYFLKAPIVGTGLGSTAAVFRGETPLNTGAGAPHNEYVRFLCDTGLIGLFLLCATLWTSLAATWRVAGTSESHKTLGAAALGAVLAVIVVSVTDNSVQIVVEFAAPAAALVAAAIAWRPSGGA